MSDRVRLARAFPAGCVKFFSGLVAFLALDRVFSDCLGFSIKKSWHMCALGWLRMKNYDLYIFIVVVGSGRVF